MNTFIEALSEMAGKDTKVRAVLKRSLSFEPGTYPPAFPYIEPFLGKETWGWRREAYYLTAGLWAAKRQDIAGGGLSLAAACGTFYLKNDKSPSTEKRFIALLDADEDQLAARLRRMVAILKEYQINFNQLLKDVVAWKNDKRYVQLQWAKEFYRSE